MQQYRHTRNICYLLLLHDNNGCYVTRTLPVLSDNSRLKIDHNKTLTLALIAMCSSRYSSLTVPVNYPSRFVVAYFNAYKFSISNKQHVLCIKNGLRSQFGYA